MNLFRSPKLQNAVFFLLLVAFCCAPVWAVEYFINQDGSAHLYSSQVMLELLRYNPKFTEIFAFNSISVPNSSGHWLMAFLLFFFSSFTVTKIMVTLTFAGLVASAGWLRLKTAGAGGLKTSFLIGAAIGFNWLWQCGFYNFLIGVCCFVLTVGLIFGWREKMNLWRAVILAVLFLLAYFSHIISFVILAGSIFLILLSAEKSYLKRNLVFFFAGLLPVLPLAVIYKSISAAGGGFFPVWRNLANPFSPLSWLTQIRTADPFILISRKSVPFIAENSVYFAVFTPLLWILAAFLALSVASFLDKDKTNLLSSKNLIFAFLFSALVLAAMFAPDDFGLNNGSVLRERLLLCGLFFFVPLFRVQNSIKLKRLAQFCLFVVVAFQTLAMWEYSIQANAEAKEFLTAQSVITPEDKTASLVLVENGLRFHSLPMTQMNNYLGIEKNAVVWDNYEIGHYLFPVVARNPADKQFVFEFTQRNAFFDPNRNFDEQLAKLEACLEENHGKITALIFWGKDARVEAVLGKWFAPVFENGRVRAFRHKP